LRVSQSTSHQESRSFAAIASEVWHEQTFVPDILPPSGKRLQLSAKFAVIPRSGQGRRWAAIMDRTDRDNSQALLGHSYQAPKNILGHTVRTTRADSSGVPGGDESSGPDPMILASLV